MKSNSSRTTRGYWNKRLTRMIVISCLALSACSGGSSSGSGTAANVAGASNLAALTGSVVDRNIPFAAVTITANAPLGVTGAQTIGTITASANGGFTTSLALPATATSIFANATDPNDSAVVLTSYLGTSTALTSSGAIADTAYPNLDITPVTTAALAIYAQLNGLSYVNLNATAYASILENYSSDVLAIAAAIKAVGDGLCTPSTTITSTTNLAAAIAAGADLSSGTSTTLSVADSVLGGNCSTALATLPSVIAAYPVFSPQLGAGIFPSNVSVPTTTLAGTWQFQGLISETGLTQNITSASLSAGVAATPPSIFSEASLIIDGSGNISSADGNVSGTLSGSTLSVAINSGGEIYNFRGTLLAIPAAAVANGTAYSFAGGGTNGATNILTNFSAVLAPPGATPLWNGITVAASASQANGISCAFGAPTRLNGFVAGVGGGSIGECITPNVGGWTMSEPTQVSNSYSWGWSGNTSSSPAPQLIAPTWTEAPSAPFVLNDASASFVSSASGSASTTTNGQTYYVLGSHAIEFAGGISGSSNTNNSYFTMLSNSFSAVPILFH